MPRHILTIKRAQLPPVTLPGNLARSSTSHSSGSFYFEMTIVSASNLAQVGVGVDNGVETVNGPGGQAGGVIWLGNGLVDYNAAGLLSTIATFAVRDILGVAINITSGQIWFRDGSGNWNNSGSANPATPSGGISIPAVAGNVYAVAQVTNAFDEIAANFAGPFANVAPSGFGTW